MLKNYFTLAYRNLLKNKVASLVSMTGLSVAIGCGIVAYMFVSSMVLSESLHEHEDTIFQLQSIQEVDGQTVIQGRTPSPVGPLIEKDNAQIVRTVRIREALLTVEHGSAQFGQLFRFVDPEYLSMFTIPLKYGHADILRDPAALVLSENTAVKYFGDSNPVGQTLDITTGSGEMKSYVVKGVAEQFAIESVANFSILTAYDNHEALVQSEAEQHESVDWSTTVRATFVQLSHARERRNIESFLDTYVGVYNANVQADTDVIGFRLDKLSNLIFSADEVKNPIRGSLPMAPIILLSVITLFLFTLACVNYINISLGGAHARVKEIGIRKVMGSRKGQLIRQFLVENILLCFLALVGGIVLAATLLLPAFGVISGQYMRLEFAQRLDLWQFVGVTLLFTALVSGAYPAFFISSFKPVAIFTGKFKSSGPNRFMQSLLTVQFILAFVTMIICVGFTLNLSYLKNLDWGYDNQHTLVIRLHPEAYDFMADKASQLAQVEYVSGAKNHVGRWHGNRTVLSKAGVEQDAVRFVVGDKYFDIIRPTLIAGEYPSRPQQVLINASMAGRLGEGILVGQTVTHEDLEYQISGVVKDFHYSSFSDAIEPAVFTIGDASEFGYLLVRLQDGAEEDVVASMATAMQEAYPGSGLDYYFQAESFDRFFEEGEGINQIFYFTAIVALLLSCAGLFGLVTQHTNSKLKEMSIRKILGASVAHIVQLGNRKFAIILVVAAIIAIPISFLLLTNLLDSFIDYRMGIGAAPFLIAISFTALIAIATISIQARRLVTVNPAELLRYE